MSPLPFYRSASLLRIRGEDQETLFVSGFGPDSEGAEAARFTLLDGTRRAIFEANEAEGLSLTRHNVLPYIRFFCEMLRDHEGRNFPIVESMEGIEGSAEHSYVGPLTFLRRDSDTRYICDGTMLYDNRIRFVILAVTPDGVVTMIENDDEG